MDEARVNEQRVDEARVDEARVDEQRVDEAHMDEQRVDEARMDEAIHTPAPPCATEPSDLRPPPGVPPAARWVDVDQEWQLSDTDPDGALDGPYRSWRADGTLRTIAAHSHGKQVGPAWRFHPDGSLLSLGQFVDGSPRGVHRRYASSDFRGERLQSCCVPEGAWQLRQEHGSRGLVDRAWFNRDGARLLENGELYPPHPPGVPAEARFNAKACQWEAGVIQEESGPTGTRRCWSSDGVLRLVEDLSGGKRHGVLKIFDEAGVLRWDGHCADGRLTGPFRAMGFPVGHFADHTARQQEGAFLDDQAVDVWCIRDDGGAVGAKRDLGLPLDNSSLATSPVFADEQRLPQAWRDLASSLVAERRVAEALLAAARATAACGDPSALVDALDTMTIRLGPDAARALAGDTVQTAGAQLIPLLDALKRGADAAVVICAIGRALQSADRAALDFLTAALLLRPDSNAPLATRALVRGSMGDLPAARADIARLAELAPEEAKMLDLFLRAYFPRFDYWPARQSTEIREGDTVLWPERTLTEVRDVIMRYATRLDLLRVAVRTWVANDVPFMIPDLAALLPAGPVPLVKTAFTMSAEEYAGGDDSADAPDQGDDGTPASDTTAPPPIEITIDETHGLTFQDTTLLAILRQARADWSGLTWLCWAVGLDAPALPDEIRPPPTFAGAAMMTMERTWRCRDKLNTSGLLALTKGIPGFDWEGTPIDLVPAPLVELALGEYLEARAVFSWLCDPANRSPWQDDLRDAR